MNILVVTAMFPPIRTGTSFYSKNLAATLHKLGHNVIVVTVQNNNEIEDTYPYKLYRLKALHINARNFFKHLRISSVFLSNYRNIQKIAQENRSDTIVLVNHYLDIAFPAIYAAQRLKLPLYISVGTQLQSLNIFRNKVLRILDRIICGRLIFPFCKNIISWDSEIERYIYEVQRKKIAQKSVIIPFGANGDINHFMNYQHNYTKTDQIIGIGAIISQRDYLFQLRVLKELLNDFPDLRFKIIGHIYIKAPLLLAKELGIVDKVEFLGELTHDQVIYEMKNSAIHWMMLSGEYVGLGTATIEAMTLGIPCVSNVPANLLGKPLLKDMENYIFSDGQKISTFKQKISSVLVNESLRKSIGLAGREFVKNNLGWDYVGKEFINLFENSIQRNG